MKKTLLLLALALAVTGGGNSRAEVQPLRIGVLASLSGFAAMHGRAVLDGALLAKAELEQRGVAVELFVEDDQSQMRNTVTAFTKLLSANKVQAIICGSWWINSVVKMAEKRRIPLLSAETLLTKDTILGATYFILGGDLKNWIRVLEPLVIEHSLKRGAILYASSGFAETINDQFTALFSQNGRKLVFAQQYSSLDARDSLSKLLQLRKAKPDVLYIEGQPEGLSNVLGELKKLQLTDITILTNSIAETLLLEQSAVFEGFKQVFYTTRADYKKSFAVAFEKHWHRPPMLNSDLGYYATLLASEALQLVDPLAALRSGTLRFAGKPFILDSSNAYHGAAQRVLEIQ